MSSPQAFTGLVQGLLQQRRGADLEEDRHPLKEHRAAVRNRNMLASLKASQCVDTGHNFVEPKILNHANNWTARFLNKRSSETKPHSTNA